MVILQQQGAVSLMPAAAGGRTVFRPGWGGAGEARRLCLFLAEFIAASPPFLSRPAGQPGRLMWRPG